MSERIAIVAIDGPGGSGKSTVARTVAAMLGTEWLDTGAMYRAVTLMALRRGLALDDDATLGGLARTLDLRVGARVTLDGEDVSEAIRSGEVNQAVSIVAANPSVRADLVRRQRAWVEEQGGGVVEGRDITSVVLPDADVKVYLTASEEERARRRSAEHAAAGQLASTDATQAAIAARDRLDSSRSISPLVVADGAVVIDSTNRTAEEVATEIVKMVEESGAG